MKILHKIFANSFLMAILFAMLLLPLGAMGLSSVQQNSVLSSTSTRDDTTTVQTETQPIVQQTPDQSTESTTLYP